MIGMTFLNYGSPIIKKKILICLGECDPIDDTEIIIVLTNKDLFLQFQLIIAEEDPDIITGYNIFSFDIPYLMNRAKYLKVPNQFYNLSKLSYKQCIMKYNYMLNSNLCSNEINYIDMSGRVQIDLLKIIQRDYPLDSYRLDNVIKNFFESESNIYHLNMIDIIRLYKGGSDKRKFLAEHCINNCSFISLLCNKLDIFKIIKLAW
jgi:DNA polymerase delta subunit 1